MQLVQSEGHPRGGISPNRSSVESGIEVAFALVQVGDLLGADIGQRLELAGVQENKMRLGEHSG